MQHGSFKKLDLYCEAEGGKSAKWMVNVMEGNDVLSANVKTSGAGSRNLHAVLNPSSACRKHCKSGIRHLMLRSLFVY